MAYSYTESFRSKMNWGNVFNRSNATPLDRSSLFGSLADAEKYVKGDGSDERNLGETSYIGQIITVIENDKVDVYKIGCKSGEDGVVTKTLEPIGGTGKGTKLIEKFTFAEGTDNINEATADNIGQLIYTTTETTHTPVGGGDELTYSIGAYIVTGAGTVMKVGTSNATGEDIAGDVETLKGRVSTLEGAVGDSTKGLVKKVADLEGSNSKNVKSIAVGGEELMPTDGKVTINYADSVEGDTDLDKAITKEAVQVKFNTVNSYLEEKFTISQADSLPDSNQNLYTIYMVPVKSEEEVIGYTYHLYLNGEWVLISTTVKASATQDGLMSKEDKVRLDDLQPIDETTLNNLFNKQN